MLRRSIIINILGCSNNSHTFKDFFFQNMSKIYSNEDRKPVQELIFPNKVIENLSIELLNVAFLISELKHLFLSENKILPGKFTFRNDDDLVGYKILAIEDGRLLIAKETYSEYFQSNSQLEVLIRAKLTSSGLFELDSSSPKCYSGPVIGSMQKDISLEKMNKSGVNKLTPEEIIESLSYAHDQVRNRYPLSPNHVYGLPVESAKLLFQIATSVSSKGHLFLKSDRTRKLFEDQIEQTHVVLVDNVPHTVVLNSNKKRTLEISKSNTDGTKNVLFFYTYNMSTSLLGLAADHSE